MKKVFVLIGSNRKNGNTTKLASHLLNNLDKSKFSIEYSHVKDYKINSCTGCQFCFDNAKCILKDDLQTLQDKIISSDIFVIASPVYLHYMTADLKLVLDRCAWWAHTLRLQGKPVIVLSTCSSNGNMSVLNAISNIMNFMGGNVIATVNASQIPNQINNEEWLNEISIAILKRINKYAKLPPQSNKFLEQAFIGAKINILEQKQYKNITGFKLGELNFWEKTGMIEFETFSDYLNSKF